MSKPKKPVPLKAIYTGRRLVGNDQVRQRFLLPDGREMNFTGVRGLILGCTYECGKGSISRRPKRLDEPRVDNPTWEGLDALVDDLQAKRRAQRKAEALSKPALKAAIAAITPLVEEILAPWDRAAVIKLLVGEAEKALQKQRRRS